MLITSFFQLFLLEFYYGHYARIQIRKILIFNDRSGLLNTQQTFVVPRVVGEIAKQGKLEVFQGHLAGIEVSNIISFFCRRGCFRGLIIGGVVLKA